MKGKLCIAIIALILVAIWGPISGECSDNPKVQRFNVFLCNWKEAKEIYTASEYESLIGLTPFVGWLNALEDYRILDIFEHPGLGTCVRVYLVEYTALKGVKGGGRFKVEKEPVDHWRMKANGNAWEIYYHGKRFLLLLRDEDIPEEMYDNFVIFLVNTLNGVQ